MIPTARVFPIPRFFFKGSLVDPGVRASNEHIPIVRVSRAQESHLSTILIMLWDHGLIVHRDRHAHMWNSSPIQTHPTSLQRSALHTSHVQ